MINFLRSSSFLIHSFVLTEILLLLLLLLFVPSMANNTLTSSQSEVKARGIYLSCAEGGTNCIGVSNDPKCIERKSCEYLLAYVMDFDDDAISFTVLANVFSADNKYVAVGFGEFGRMINNSVVGCLRYKDKLNIHLSMNDDTLQNHWNVPQTPLTPIEINTDETGEKLFCTFKLKMVFNLNGIPFNLNSIPYYVLFASGSTANLKKLNYHKTWSSTISESALNLLTEADQNIIQPRNKNMNKIRVHTCFFSFVFVFLVPTSGMFARFFKESYIERRICNKRMWFTIHWLSSLTSVVLIVGAYWVVAEMNTKARIRSAKLVFHDRFGSAVVFLSVAVATSGLLIGCVTPVSCLRRLFSALHCFLGNIVYILGLVQIFLSVWTTPFYMSYCSASEATILAWICFHFIMYAILTGILYRRDRIDARIQQLHTLQGMILAAKNSSIKRFHDPEFAFAARGLNRRHTAAAVAKASSTVLEKTVEDMERTDKIIDSINYNKRIIEKLYRLNRTVKSKKKQQRISEPKAIGGGVLLQAENREYRESSKPYPNNKLDQKNNRNKSVKAKISPITNQPQNQQQSSSGGQNQRQSNGTAKNPNTVSPKVPASFDGGNPANKDRGQKDVKGLASSFNVQVQLPKKFQKNAKRNIMRRNEQKLNQKKANGQKNNKMSAGTQITAAPSAFPVVVKPDVHKSSILSDKEPFFIRRSEDDYASDGSDEDLQDYNTAPRLTVEFVGEYTQDGRRVSSFRKRKRSSVNPEDPEDFLNHFHSQPRDLDPYRALAQYPLQPQIAEYAHTTAVTFLLVFFAVVSFGTAVMIAYFTYADQYNPGCFLGRDLLILQQW